MHKNFCLAWLKNIRYFFKNGWKILKTCDIISCGIMNQKGFRTVNIKTGNLFDVAARIAEGTS